MKERLNLTIDGEVLEAMKVYAAGKQMSVSELVESYFRAVIRPAGRKSLLDLVDALERPGKPGEAPAGSRGTRGPGMTVGGEAAIVRPGGADREGKAVATGGMNEEVDHGL